MRSRATLIAFGAGVVAAGAVAGLARIAGLEEPPAAIAEVPAPPPAAPGPDAPGVAAAPIKAALEKSAAKPAPRWRDRKRARREEVPGAGVLARVASRRGVDRPRCAPAKESAGDAGDGPASQAPRTATRTERCEPEQERVESVEIEWHAPSRTP